MSDVSNAAVSERELSGDQCQNEGETRLRFRQNSVDFSLRARVTAPKTNRVRAEEEKFLYLGHQR